MKIFLTHFDPILCIFHTSSLGFINYMIITSLIILFVLLQTLPTEEPVVIPLDLGDLETLEGFIHKVHDICGRIDILINNGGISHRGSILRTKFEVDKKIMHVNYFGSVVLTKGISAKCCDLCMFYNVK